MTREPALLVRDLNAWYGESHILHGMSFEVPAGTLLSLLGRNGSGRSTTLRAILGLTSRRSGSVRIHGHETIDLPTHRIAPLGLGWCPEERAIFASLTVEENLMLPPRVGDGGMPIEELYQLFPQLAERRRSQGTRLSGGEQQMLALARILRTGARLLLLDEITEGLAPVIVQKLEETLQLLKARGFTIVLAEQNLHVAARLADAVALVEHGQVTDAFPVAELAARRAEVEARLGV
ncbi:MAG: ABC transporter ATP-binding protein [Pseudomonadota bacterium]|nr:ABC transporter ATP-binding protein [Pseudomonadota bacterium]